MTRRLLNIFLIITILAALLVLQFAPPNFDYPIRILCLLGINIIMALGLNLINGMTGQFSLGHAGFMAIGAYTSAFISTQYGEIILKKLSFLSSPFIFASTFTNTQHAWATQFLIKLSNLAPLSLAFLVTLLLGALMAALAGLIIGIPTLRLKGDYLAIATLGFGEIIRVLITNFEFLGASKGLNGIPQYSNLIWIFIFAALTFFVLKNLINSSKGMALLAIREDEIAAMAMGIDCTRFKIMAFVLGAFIAGIGGALYAHYETYITPDSFNFMKSIEYLVIIVLAGMGSLTRIIFAATFLTFLPQILRFIPPISIGETVINLADSRMIIYALLLILIMIGRSKNWMSSRTQ